MNIHDFGMDSKSNLLLSTAYELLLSFDNERQFRAMRLAPKDCITMLEICDEGVQNFEDASKGICPLQRAMTGIRYTINALREWKEKGPLYEPPNEVLSKI